MVSIILAFFVFNLTGCKGKKEEETQISQQAANAAEVAEKPAAETKAEEKAEKSELKSKEEIKEELLPPKLIWEKVIDTKKLIFKQELHFVDEKLKEELISENPELSELLSEENLHPFILLEGKEKQYLFDGKGNMKEIAYPSSDLIFEKKYRGFGEFTIKRRNGEVLWKKTVGKDIGKDGSWEEFFDTVLFSPDRSWLIVYFEDIMDPPLFLTHITFDINGNKLWEHPSLRRVSDIWAAFSKDSKYVYFTKSYKLFKANKKEILWEVEIGNVHALIIPESGKYILVRGRTRGTSFFLSLVDNKGKILWKKYAQEIDVGTEVCTFDENEEFILVVETRGRKFSILRVSDGSVVKSITWCKAGSPIYERLWGYPASLAASDSKIALAVSSRAIKKDGDLLVTLYDISHLIKR